MNAALSNVAAHHPLLVMFVLWGALYVVRRIGEFILQVVKGAGNA